MFKIIHKATGKELTLENIYGFMEPNGYMSKYKYGGYHLQYWSFIGVDDWCRGSLWRTYIPKKIYLDLDGKIYVHCIHRVRDDDGCYDEWHKMVELPSELFEVQAITQ